MKHSTFLKQKHIPIILIAESVIAILVIVAVFAGTPAPKPITSADANVTSYQSVDLSWQSDDAPDSHEIYRLYRGDTKDKYSHIATINENQYQDQGLVPGKEYFYMIIPYNGLKRGGGEYELSVKTELDTPSIQAYITDGHVKVVATKVEGATGYKLFRDDQLISTQESSEFYDKNTKFDKEYSYSVKAYREDEITSDSASSNTETVLIHGFGAITAKADQQLNMVLNWDNGQHYDKYIVYRDGERLATVHEGPYVDESIEKDKIYKYTVQGVDAEGIIEATQSENLRVAEYEWTNEDAVNGACEWAVEIAEDDSFTYGTGDRAHRYGCYFCETNVGPRKNIKGSSLVNGHSYEKTYCCNPFVHAAFAHGAGDPNMLEACRKGQGVGMSAWTFTRYGNWTNVGKPSYSNLRRGDVLVVKYKNRSGGHMILYLGDGKAVEASGGGWTANSIRVTNCSSGRYSGFQFVMRYTGNGTGEGYRVEILDDEGKVLYEDASKRFETTEEEGSADAA